MPRTRAARDSDQPPAWWTREAIVAERSVSVAVVCARVVMIREAASSVLRVGGVGFSEREGGLVGRWMAPVVGKQGKRAARR